MSAPASGTRTLFGVMIDRQIPGQMLGCPEPIVAAMAAPSAPSASAGSVIADITIAPVGAISGPPSTAGGTYSGSGAETFDVEIDREDLAGGITTEPVGTPAGPAATGTGTYSGTGVSVFDVEIDDAEAAPATFKWRQDGGSWTTGVATSDAYPITLADGVTVTFTSPGTFGFTLGDAWTITAVETGGIPATFKWRKNTGSYTAGVNTDTAPTTLDDGVTVIFGATTGFALGDHWLISVTPAGVTGSSVLYKEAAIYAGRGEGTASAASSTISASGQGVTVTPTAAPTTGGAVVLGRRFYRSIDSGPYLEVKTRWDNTTATFTDSVKAGTEGTRTPRSGSTGLSAEQTAANYGFQFIRVDNATDFSRDDTHFKSTEQTGQLGEARGIPGMVKYAHTLNVDTRIGSIVPFLASMTSKPTVAQNSGEPVLKYAFPLSDLEADSISLSGLHYKGGDFRPQLFLGMKCSEIDFDLLGKAQAKTKLKLMGQQDTEAGFGKALSGNSGTFASVPVPRGVRSGTNAYTDSVFVKIQAAPAVALGIGSFTVRAALAAAGTLSPTFGSAVTTTVFYDPSTKRQIHPVAIGSSAATAQQSAWVELWESTTGLALGFDEGENRKPFEVYFPGDVSLLAAGDIFEIPALQKVPNVYSAANPTGPSDNGSYSGQRPRFTFTSRMTPAHVTLTRGAGAGSQAVLSAQAATFKISRPADEVEGLGPEAANPLDVDVFGKFTLSLDIERRYITREFERLAKSDARLYSVVKLQSHRIIVDPVSGTLSADREQAVFTIAQGRIDKTNAPLSGDKVITEKITIMPEQPDDDSIPGVFSLDLSTAHSWDFSRV